MSGICRSMRLTLGASSIIIGMDPAGKLMLLWNILTAAGQPLKSNWVSVRLPGSREFAGYPHGHTKQSGCQTTQGIVRYMRLRRLCLSAEGRRLSCSHDDAEKVSMSRNRPLTDRLSTILNDYFYQTIKYQLLFLLYR